MKKIFLVLLICVIYIFPNVSFATEKSSNNEEIKNEQEQTLENQKQSLGIGDFLSEAKKYTEDIDVTELFNSAISGNLDNTKILKYIINILGDNLKDALQVMSGVIVVIIIHSILKTISENLGNESVAKIAYYIQYILIVTLIMGNFSNIIEDIKISISDLTSFANTLIPLLTTLMIATGNAVSSHMIEPILLLVITFIGNFITNVLIPIVLVSTALGIISKISDYAQVDKLSKFLKKGSTLVLTTILTLFMSLATLEGGITSGLDGMTLKAGKSLVSNAIPVVGGILGDAIDTVLGYSNIIKNAVGVVGIFVIICICIKPILNLTALTITYYLGAALCQPIADKKIVSLIEQMGGTFKIFLAIMFTITVMLIIGIAIVMRISNSGLMYQ